MLRQVGRRLTPTTVGRRLKPGFRSYDRVPWVAQFGRDNFAIRGAYSASVQVEPERRSRAAGYRSAPDSLAEAGGTPALEACWAEPAGCSYLEAQPQLALVMVVHGGPVW